MSWLEENFNRLFTPPLAILRSFTTSGGRDFLSSCPKTYCFFAAIFFETLSQPSNSLWSLRTLHNLDSSKIQFSHLFVTANTNLSIWAQERDSPPLIGFRVLARTSINLEFPSAKPHIYELNLWSQIYFRNFDQVYKKNINIYNIKLLALNSLWMCPW